MSAPLRDLAARLRREIERPGATTVRASGLRGSAPALALAQLVAERPRPVLAVVPDAVAADAFTADLRFYLGDRDAAGPLARRVHHLPGWEVPPFEPLSPTRETTAARAEGLHHLVQTTAPVVVTTVEGLALRCLPRAAFAEAVTYVVRGEQVAPDGLAERLVAWGYHRVPLVQDPGDLALRGGILDVFPAGHARPLRLEFFGDEVESIREFDPTSQRSLDAIEDLLALPMQEFSRARLGPEAARRVDDRAADVGLARHERRDLVEAVRTGLALPGSEFLLPYLHEDLATVADYLPHDTLLWVVGAAELDAAIERWWTTVEEHAAAAQRDGRFFPEPSRLYLDPASWRTRACARRRTPPT
jgi:transcription-repair coupling factor (superfamily II helicase)